MSQETIKTYQGSSIGASQCLVTLEGFIGDMENAELADDSTVDASDAVTAINGLIWEVERREAEVERLLRLAEHAADMLEGAQSGYISGSISDMEFDTHRDMLVKDLRGALAE